MDINLNKRIYRNEFVQAITKEYMNLAKDVEKQLGIEIDEADLISIKNDLYDYNLYSRRDFPISTFYNGIKNLISLKESEVKILKTDKNFLSDYFFINLEDLEQFILSLKVILKKIEPYKKSTSGRREEFFKKSLIKSLEIIWVKYKNTSITSNEALAWIKASINLVDKIQSTQSLSQMIRRMQKE